MIVMLAVLYMLITRARDPNVWRWLANESGAVEEADDAATAPAKQAAAAAEPGAEAPGQPAPEKPPAEPAATGPTDEDPEERAAIEEEFQAVTDKTLQIGPVEMFAYRRVLQWVVNQPISVMRKRARKDLTFHDYITASDKLRGAMVELVLDAALITECDLRASDGSTLYEVWGPEADSRSGTWLYDTLVVNLPKGMPVGRRVTERVRFVGYFFKLQAYHEAGAKPHAPPLVAPMFIGRLIWIRPEPPPPSSWNATWALVLVGGFGLVVVLQLAWMFFRASRRKSRIRPLGEPKPGSLEIDAWIEGAEQRGSPPGDEMPQGEPSPEPGRNEEGDGEHLSHPLDDEPRDGG